MRLTSFVAGTTSAQEAGTTWLIDVHFPQMSISSSLSCSNCRTAALKLRSYGTLSDMQMPRWDGKQPAAETVPRTEKLQPLSDVWIKVELFPSCLHNNTRYRSSAAVSACGWHYLSGRHSLSDLQMDLALLQSQSLWTKGMSWNWAIYLVKHSLKCHAVSLSLSATVVCVHLFRLVLKVLSHSSSQWTGLM